MRTTLVALGVALVLAFMPGTARADAFIFGFTPFGVQTLTLTTSTGSVVLNATSTGWWDQTGLHNSTNPNYLICFPGGHFCPDFLGFHDFFVFGLNSVTGTITSAFLSIGNPVGGFDSTDPTDLLSMYDVSTPISTLTASGTGQTGIYADLGSGILYGSQVVSSVDNGTQVLITLNSAAISALNLARGGSFAFGGDLAAVPEPGAAGLLLTGLAIIGWLARQRGVR